jgi:hypothetical protein
MSACVLSPADVAIDVAGGNGIFANVARYEISGAVYPGFLCRRLKPCG